MMPIHLSNSGTKLNSTLEMISYLLGINPTRPDSNLFSIVNRPVSQAKEKNREDNSQGYIEISHRSKQSSPVFTINTPVMEHMTTGEKELLSTLENKKAIVSVSTMNDTNYSFEFSADTDRTKSPAIISDDDIFKIIATINDLTGSTGVSAVFNKDEEAETVTRY
jgi:hypothetical protein